MSTTQPSYLLAIPVIAEVIPSSGARAVSERCVYQSLLTCGMTLPHQSCKNFDSTGVLPPVRVVCSENLQEYGGSAARYFWKAIIECISSLRCGVRYAIYGGGRLSTSVLFLISVCESIRKTLKCLRMLKLT